MMVCEGSVGFPGNDGLVELCSWKGVVVKMMVCIREDGGFVFFLFFFVESGGMDNSLYVLDG